MSTPRTIDAQKKYYVSIEVPELRHTQPVFRTVFVQGIAQQYLHDVDGHLDCFVAGNKISLADGVRLNITAGGSGKHFGTAGHGTLTTDLQVRCLDGVTRILPAGSPVEVDYAKREQTTAV